MPRRWLLLNELVFAVYRDRRCKTKVKVTVGNADSGDKVFLVTVARLIGVWTSTKEVALCPKSKRLSD